MFFSQDKRPEIKMKTPDSTIGEVAKQLGARWKSLSEDEKKPYEKLAREDRERYMEEMAEYKKSGVADKGKKPTQQQQKQRGRKPKVVVEEEEDEEEEEEEEEEDSSSD